MDFINCIHLLDSMYKLVKLQNGKTCSIIYFLDYSWSHEENGLARRKYSCNWNWNPAHTLSYLLCSQSTCSSRGQTGRNRHFSAQISLLACVSVSLTCQSIDCPFFIQRIHLETCKMWVLITHDRLCCNSSAEVIVALRVVEWHPGCHWDNEEINCILFLPCSFLASVGAFICSAVPRTCSHLPLSIFVNDCVAFCLQWPCVLYLESCWGVLNYSSFSGYLDLAAPCYFALCFEAQYVYRSAFCSPPLQMHWVLRQWTADGSCSITDLS